MEMSALAPNSLPLQVTLPPRASPVSSPTRHSATAGNTAVIRSPMAMAAPQAYGAGLVSVAGTALLAERGAVENASPLSTTTAAEYAEIEQKQVELRSVVENRIAALERALRQRESELEALRMQLAKTEEDYQFNYDLIRDRDVALEEAATQLQSMYDELKRRKAEEVSTAKRLEGLEQEVHQLRQRLRETEVQREQTVLSLQQAHQFKETQLKEKVTQKEKELDDEKQRLHDEYLRRFKSLDDAQAEIKEKNEVLVAELEKKFGQQMKRLEEKLSATTAMLEGVQHEKAVCETRCAELLQALSLIKHEYETQKQLHQTAMAEASDRQREFETKLSECSTIMGQGIATAEDSIRLQTRRAAKLEMECGQLQMQVTELQQRLQAAQLQHDEDRRRFTEENCEMQERYRQAAAQAEKQCQIRNDTERELTLRLQRLQGELESTRQKCEMASTRVGELQNRYEISERERTQCEQELERLRREIQRCHEELQRTAENALESQRVADEKVRSACVRAEAAQEEAERLKKRLFEAQERAQAEEARLTRELHASEAARRALEEHFHLLDDKNGQRALVDGLRSDKERLERKVLEMERTNAAIREQVASFTMELQNDPAMKTAKETQRRVQELQEELLRARDDVQRLNDVLHEREKELSHCKLEILRLQSVEKALLHYREDYQNMKEAYERLRHSRKDLQKDQKRGERRRKSSSRPAQLADDSNSDGVGDAKGNEQCNSKRIFGELERSKVLIKEGEFWRQKSLKLEQHLRDFIAERDRLTRELHLLRQDVDALTSEKQSLVDLNSLLKAQLRDAYRTALEYPKQSSSPQPVALHKGEQQYTATANVAQQANFKTTAGHGEVQESPQSTPLLAVDGVLRRTSAPESSLDAERLAVLEEELAAMKAHMSAQQQGVHYVAGADGGNSGPRSRGSFLRAPSRRQQGQDQEHRQQQQQQQQQRSLTGRLVTRSKAPVVHKGSSVVRHYGYS